MAHNRDEFLPVVCRMQNIGSIILKIATNQKIPSHLGQWDCREFGPYLHLVLTVAQVSGRGEQVLRALLACEQLKGPNDTN